MLSVIVPASNEEALIGACLGALAASAPVPGGAEVIVVANGCRDRTVAVAQALRPTLERGGWALTVLDLPRGGKLGALNAGDRAARGEVRAYLDADVTVSPGLMAGLAATLARPDPAYASGRVRITGRSLTSCLYARLWSRVPFMARGVPGCGLFAVNAAGRARWGDWPDIISDDTFARLNFTPAERHPVDAPYAWPIAEGFGALVRVRRRQDRGVREIAARFPALPANDDKLPLGAGGMARLALGDPAGFAVYAGVALAVRLGTGTGWERGR